MSTRYAVVLVAMLLLCAYGCTPAETAPASPTPSAPETSVAPPLPTEAAPAPPVESAPAQVSAEPVATTAPAETSAVPAEGTTASEPITWDYDRYLKLAEKTDRSMKVSKQAFDAIQKRKEPAAKRVERYLKERFKTADPEVLRAFSELPREYFHYNYEGRFATVSSAYEDEPKPWALGYGSALSDYLGQVYMTQLAAPKPGETVLEIGTGSGYQSALLSRIVKDVYSIEIIEPLGKSVGKVLESLELGNVHARVGDGYFGWPEVQGGFDIIMVTCAARYVPPALLEQLKPGGRLLIPVGPPIKGRQVLYVYTKDAEGKVHSRRDVGVFFIPMTGAMQKEKAPAQQAKALPGE